MQKSICRAPEAILFDCDGTLLLTAGLHFDAISRAVERQGAQMPRDWYMSQTGLGRSDLFGRFANDFALSLDLQRLAADSIALTVAMAGQALENPAVAGLARTLAGRLPIAVVTNSEAAVAEALLNATGLRAVFNVVLTVNDVVHPKPAPDLYCLAAGRLAVAPDRCLVLEDSAQGIDAAKSAGAMWLDVRDPNWLDLFQEHFGSTDVALLMSGQHRALR